MENLKKLQAIVTEVVTEQESTLELKNEEEPSESNKSLKIVFNQPGASDDQCFIEGKILTQAENSIQITMKTPIESSELTLTNIDLENATEIENLKENYLNSFVRHAGEILTNKEQVLEEIKSIVKEATVENYNVGLEDQEGEGE